MHSFARKSDQIHLLDDIEEDFSEDEDFGFDFDTKGQSDFAHAPNVVRFDSGPTPAHNAFARSFPVDSVASVLHHQLDGEGEYRDEYRDKDEDDYDVEDEEGNGRASNLFTYPVDAPADTGLYHTHFPTQPPSQTEPTLPSPSPSNQSPNPPTSETTQAGFVPTVTSATSSAGSFGLFIGTLAMPVRVLEIQAETQNLPIVRVCVTASFSVSKPLQGICRARRIVPVFRFPWAQVWDYANQTRQTSLYVQRPMFGRGSTAVPRRVTSKPAKWDPDLRVTRGTNPSVARTVPWQIDPLEWEAGVLHMAAADLFDHPDDDGVGGDDDDEEDFDDVEMGSEAGGKTSSSGNGRGRDATAQHRKKPSRWTAEHVLMAKSLGIDEQDAKLTWKSAVSGYNRSKEFTIHISFRQVLERVGGHLVFAFATTSMTQFIRREELNIISGGIQVDWPPNTQNLESPTHDLVASSSRRHTRVQIDEANTKPDELQSWITRDFICASPIDPLWETNHTFWDWITYFIITMIVILLSIATLFYDTYIPE